MTPIQPPFQQFQTGEPPPRERADKWLSAHFPDFSRSQIQTWFREGRVTREDGSPVKPGEILPPGCVVRVQVPEPVEKSLPAGAPMDLEILHEDESLIVVNKPHDLVVHPAPGHPDGTLTNALLHLYPDLAGVGDPMRPGLVHRLDADTSGVIVFARTPEALEDLQRQFHDRETQKTYQCLVRGIPSSAEGEIDLPLGRHPVDRKRRAVNGVGARPALTRFRMLEGLAAGSAAHFEVEIHTGRTHQIRVHLAHIHHPVLGDTVYGGRRPQLAGGWPQATRQMLHAFRLRFSHPRHKVPLEITAPLPEDMKTYLEALRNRNP
ncbi:MAG: RluA family pseudouridine synthase [Verrucomicrobia bacterium]|nr:RluA family pseudouridine synthase [Verrucomicrobiota bacterium]MCH8513625.1 RluA family pseudouridine synthase [Kiritimatiellia bacterium]